MLYELLILDGKPAFEGVPGLWLLTFISTRTVAAVLTAFLLALWLGRRTIVAFTSAGVSEDVGSSPSETVRKLHAGKRGTPTMGGLFLIAALLASSILWGRFDGPNVYTLPGLLLILWFALVGLFDDGIKAFVPFVGGLRARHKQRALTIGALAVGLWVLLASPTSPSLQFPVLSTGEIGLGGLWGVPFLIVAVLVLTGSANAVNLTDGMDGLAAGCVLTSAAAFCGICYFVGHARLADYLSVDHVAGSGEITVLLGALIGATMAFLWFNAPPAQIFMGDVGSLALGGGLGYAALVSRTELVLFVVGGVFVAESLSVMVQVASFRARGRRVFRCAPLHHHFEFGGVPETRIVVRTWLVSALLALTSLALFKVR